MDKEKILAKIILRLPLTEAEKAYSILYMGFELTDLEGLYSTL